MLQSIRDRTHGWIATVIISLVILSFALWGVHSYMIGGSNTSVVAKVNGAEITKTQLAGAYERVRRQMQANTESNNLSESVEADLKVKALQGLINVQVLKQGSISENYRVSSRQVDGFLESMPEFQVGGHFSLPRLQQYLATTLLSAGDFLELIQSNLLIEQPRLGIIFSSFALPNEVTETIALVNQERDFDYLVLTQNNFQNAVAAISPGEIKAYYDTHQNEFKTPEQLSVEYVEISLKDLMASIHPADDALKTYYNENINTYTNPMQISMAKVEVPLAETATDKDVSTAEDQAMALRSELLGKTKASAKTTNFNNDKSSRKWITINDLPVELQKGAATLTKAGDVSEPIVTAHGIVIMKAFEVKQPEVQVFATVKDKVQANLVKQLAQEKYAKLKDSLATVSYEYPDSLQTTSKNLSLPIQTSELFTKEKGGKDISDSKKIRDAAFSSDVLNAQENSDVIQISSDESIVLRIKSHLPASLLPLSSVTKQIADTLTTTKAQAKAEAVAHEINSKLQAGMPLAQIATEYHLTWSSVGYLGRYSNKVDPALLEAAFSMPKNPNGMQFNTTKIPSGFAVVALKSVRNGSIDQHSEQYDVFAEQVQNSEGMLEYKLFQDSLVKHAKIVSYLNN